MANSFGGAIAEGVPVIMQGGPVPEVMVRDNVEAKAKALDTMNAMGLIKIVIVPDKPSNVSQAGLPPNVRRIW